MENVQASYPLQLVHLDYFTIDMTEGGNEAHVLNITDHFMRYAQAWWHHHRLQSVQHKLCGTDL